MLLLACLQKKDAVDTFLLYKLKNPSSLLFFKPANIPFILTCLQLIVNQLKSLCVCLDDRNVSEN